ncbi:MAG: hypoxanthine phosphoribosyltransferase [Bacteroidales bacterium]
MNTIRIKDKEFQISIPYDSIYKAVKKIADRINEDYKNIETPVFLSILNGAFMFTADLFKELNINSYLSFVKFASYQGTSSSGEVKELIGINENLEGKNVIVLEDIVDSGLTIRQVTDAVESLQPKEMRVATLFLKPEIFNGEITLDYVGMKVPNDFIIGYGLDYEGLGRNFRDIYKAVSR